MAEQQSPSVGPFPSCTSRQTEIHAPLVVNVRSMQQDFLEKEPTSDDLSPLHSPLFVERTSMDDLSSTTVSDHADGEVFPSSVLQTESPDWRTSLQPEGRGTYTPAAPSQQPAVQLLDLLTPISENAVDEYNCHLSPYERLPLVRSGSVPRRFLCQMTQLFLPPHLKGTYVQYERVPIYNWLAGEDTAAGLPGNSEADGVQTPRALLASILLTLFLVLSYTFLTVAHVTEVVLVNVTTMGALLVYTARKELLRAGIRRVIVACALSAILAGLMIWQKAVWRRTNAVRT